MVNRAVAGPPWAGPALRLGVLETDAGMAIFSAAGSLLRAAPQSAGQSL
jgi:hypothetical protein